MAAEAHLDVPRLLEEVMEQRAVGVHLARGDGGLLAHVLARARLAVGHGRERQDGDVRDDRHGHALGRVSERALQPVELLLVEVADVAVALRLHAVEADEAPRAVVERVPRARLAEEVAREALAPVGLGAGGLALLLVPAKDVVVAGGVADGNAAFALERALEELAQFLGAAALGLEDVHHRVATGDDEVGLLLLRVDERRSHAGLRAELGLHMDVGEVRQANGAGDAGGGRCDGGRSRRGLRIARGKGGAHGGKRARTGKRGAEEGAAVGGSGAFVVRHAVHTGGVARG